MVALTAVWSLRLYITQKLAVCSSDTTIPYDDVDAETREYLKRLPIRRSSATTNRAKDRCGVLGPPLII